MPRKQRGWKRSTKPKWKPSTKHPWRGLFIKKPKKT